MKKNKIDITYDIYFYNIYSEIMKELVEIESNIFQNLTDAQILIYMKKIQYILIFFQEKYIQSMIITKNSIQEEVEIHGNQNKRS